LTWGIPSNHSQIESSWRNLSLPEQEAVFRHLEELQKKDWKQLTIDQKKAG
jgi:cytochrome c oxidase subunit 4